MNGYLYFSLILHVHACASILLPISHKRLMTRSMINAETGRRGDAEKIKIFSNISNDDDEVVTFSLINQSPLRLPVSLSLRFISVFAYEKSALARARVMSEKYIHTHS